ncbi:MAG: hypothetical protein AUG51_18465 [Acidobacteria bacterium 13_1_20CM_3_53_8]|nr:MAG: hypothetical protein AUG51_18465 [Acidobacteria bacterium 13_1_20CM_3_53_8]
MRQFPKFFAATIASLFLCLTIAQAQTGSSVQASAQASSTSALERGYRTGYSDGYPAGYNDSASGAHRDFRNHTDYRRADRAYQVTYGDLEDYRDGYQQGYEAGYNSGYDRHSFDSTIPANLARRGVTNDAPNAGGTVIVNPGSNDNNSSVSATVNTSGSSQQQTSQQIPQRQTRNGTLVIPANSVLVVELLNRISTDVSQRGDRFQARVVEPAEWQGAIIEGHIAQVKRAGRVRSTSELQLAFDQISLNGGWTKFDAQVVEVLAASGSVGNVDPEGGVHGTDSTGHDAARIGTGAGVGAVIGAIFGGAKGAAVGAAIGAGASTGGVLTSRGRDISLAEGQQLRIRTSSEARL